MDNTHRIEFHKRQRMRDRKLTKCENKKSKPNSVEAKNGKIKCCM